MRALSACLIFLAAALAQATPVSPPSPYMWLRTYDPSETIVHRIQPPDGYERIGVMPSTFENWLRHLPLKKCRPPVRLYNRAEKPNQKAHFAVIDIDVGDRNLQQCADAVIRLRAEYLYATGKYDAIHFKFTSGDNAAFKKWIEGYRPIVDGNRVRWERSAERDSSYASFREYLNTVFTYAGSDSLSRELRRVKEVSKMRIGDVFIQGGFPGHAVIVVDMAVNGETGKKVFLLAQSYMPAQDIHVLKNPTDSKLSPWYIVEFGETLQTPEWVFRRTDLRRFR